MPANEVLLTTYGFTLSIPDIDTIGRFSRCSGLEMAFDIYEYREGGNNEMVHRLPGGLHYPNLVLSRGLTNEDALMKWFWATKTQAERKEVILTLNASGSARVWSFADAFPIRWTGPEQLSAEAVSIATETLEIAHSGLKMA